MRPESWHERDLVAVTHASQRREEFGTENRIETLQHGAVPLRKSFAPFGVRHPFPTISPPGMASLQLGST